MNTPLRIVADRHVWHVEQAFSRFPGYDVTLETWEAADICADVLHHADVLITRSGTRVNPSLLENSPVRFVATATIGDDHIDLAYLQQRGIAFASAAGSSTGSVVEYMMAVLLHLHANRHIALDRHTLGIIGVGRIGGLLLDMCRRLNIKTLCNDPPRSAMEPDAPLENLDVLLRHADILTIHTPLLVDGEHPTRHLINRNVLSDFQGFGIINAGRGSCVDNQALLDWLNRDSRHWAVLDCWEAEPAVDPVLLTHPGVLIATPHIAGHSLDGKAANTDYVYRALCEYLTCAPVWDVANELPDPRPSRVAVDEGNRWLNLHRMVAFDYPLLNDHYAEHCWLHPRSCEVAHAFRQYRRHYPVRRTWSACPWEYKSEGIRQAAMLLGYTS